MYGFEYDGGAGGGFGGMDPMGGGGFDAMDTGGGGFLDGGAGGKTDSGKKQYKDKLLLPTTIKQLITSPFENDALSIDGVAPDIVKFMGMIESIEEHSTVIAFRVNDGTGTIEIKAYIEKESSGTPKYRDCREGAYVRVAGTMKLYNEERHVLLFDMQVVKDFNEMTHHMLEVVMSHCQNTKGPIPGSDADKSAGRGAGTPSHYNMGMGAAGRGFSQGGGGGGGGGGGKIYKGGRGGVWLRAQVPEAIRGAGQGEEAHPGTEVQQYLQHSGVQIGMDQVRKFVHEFQNDGILYGTIDEEHFKCTEE